MESTDNNCDILGIRAWEDCKVGKKVSFIAKKGSEGPSTGPKLFYRHDQSYFNILLLQLEMTNVKLLDSLQDAVASYKMGRLQMPRYS